MTNPKSSPNVTDMVDRLEKYGGAYAGLRSAVQLCLDGLGDKEFLADTAKRLDVSLAGTPLAETIAGIAGQGGGR
jgi:hypothetical protein